MSKIKLRARKLRYELQAQEGRAISIQEVANATGMDRERLNNIELGRIKNMSVTEIEALCAYYSNALGRLVNTDEILSYDPTNRRATILEEVALSPA
jgi:DNA-binding Xre family transcriptional regulator